MIKLIASDMDGTLLDPQKNFPPDFCDTLDLLDKNNIKFVIASGRSYSAIKPLFKERCNKMTFICDNGAFVMTDGKISDINGMPIETIRDIIRFCSQHLPDVHLVLCGMNGTYISTAFNSLDSDELGFYYFTRTVYDDLLCVEDTIFKIAVYDIKNPENNSFPALRKYLGETMELQVSGSCWMDIMNKGVNKGVGLAKIQEQLGISPDETMAFGDFYNDVDLLARAKYSYVMENANEEMKKYGKYIAPSNTEYGVTKTINEYLSKIIRKEM